MCIIAVKPAGVEFDDKAEQWLVNCAAANRDGAGVMWTDGDIVHWHKGFMGAKAKERTLEYARTLPASKAAVFHFRIATHGQVNKRTTHPFPVNRGTKALRALKGKARVVLAHNGVISQMARHEKYSDTQQLVRYLNGIPNLKAAQLRYILELTDGGKFAILTPNTLTTVGEFEKEDNGWEFSNATYKGRSLASSYSPTIGGSWKHRGDYRWWEYGEESAGTAETLLDEGEQECVLCGFAHNQEAMLQDLWGDYVCEDCAVYVQEDLAAGEDGIYQYAGDEWEM